jgi:hypothetical protein
MKILVLATARLSRGDTQYVLKHTFLTKTYTNVCGFYNVCPSNYVYASAHLEHVCVRGALTRYKITRLSRLFDVRF